ncbi:MAG: hypothetical protein VYB44_07320 [Bacteroidota bacterium]|nr:hypothetical protein [Bacteroidota bacterium]
MGKKETVYGVEMTSIEEMQFAKFRNNKGIAMNTLTQAERTELVKSWLRSTDEYICSVAIKSTNVSI